MKKYFMSPSKYNSNNLVFDKVKLLRIMCWLGVITLLVCKLYFGIGIIKSISLIITTIILLAMSICVFLVVISFLSFLINKDLINPLYDWLDNNLE